MTWAEWFALGGLICNIVLTSFALWRGCQAVKEIRELRKEQHHRGRLSSFVVPFLLLLMITPALAHDSWISRGGLKNAAGEWCCGEGDCFMVEPVRITANGYLIMATGEIVPEREAQPSPDGKFWRCKRPDGSRRCFFAPSPSM